MKTLQELIQDIETFAPPALAPFDYVGLLQGESEQKVSKIGLTLDYSLQAIQKAISIGCQLLITHHGPTNISFPLVGNNAQKIFVAGRAGLSIYRCHLNLDFCENGIISELCQILQIPAKPMITTYDHTTITGGVFLAENYPLTFGQLAKRISRLKVKTFRVAGSKRSKFSKIAITSGQGFIPEFFDQLKPEVYIAGEFEQEAVMYAQDLGIMLVELSHHASEVRALTKVAVSLEKKLGIEVVPIEIVESIETVMVNW
jgi:dinuclear metal center YbgI/SA1388 family protein